MVDCANPVCRKVLPASTLIQQDFTLSTRAISSDCARNIVYLTDDPGLADINLPLGDPYLNTDTRFQLISNFTQVSEHWLDCDPADGSRSSVSRDLGYFFQVPRGTGSSPGYILAVFWDRAGGETIADALDALMLCFRCFRVVTTVSELSDGTPFYDSALQLEIQAWTQTNERVYIGLTFDPGMKASFTEVVSIAAQSSALNYDNSHFVWAGERCVPELDIACTETGTDIVELTSTDLAYAAVVASYPTTGISYIPDPFLKPVNGIPGQITADLDVSETINVTGVSIDQGGQIQGASRFANVYHDIAGRAKGLIYGDSVTGFKTYELMQSLYIKEDIESTLIDFLNQQSPVGISRLGLAALDTRLISLAQKYTNQNIISTDESEFDVPDGMILVASGNGWIIAREPIDNLSLAELAQGFSPAYFFCYVSLRHLRFIRLTICAQLKPDQGAG